MTHNMCQNKTKIGQSNIRCFTGGNGDPLVITHGSGDGARSWLENAEQLAKHYSVHIPDLPGFGASQSITDTFHLPDYVSFVEDFTHNLGIERFYLVGHSIGGGIALHYAFKHAEKVSGLVLVNSFCLGKEIALWVSVLSASVLCRSVGVAAKWLARLFYAPLSLPTRSATSR